MFSDFRYASFSIMRRKQRPGKQKGLASQACYIEHFENTADSIMTEFHFCRFSQPTLDSLVLSAVFLWLTTVVVTSMIVKLALVDSEKATKRHSFTQHFAQNKIDCHLLHLTHYAT